MTHATKKELSEQFGDLEDCQCSCCGFDTQNLHIYEDLAEGPTACRVKKFTQCDVCYSTFAGNSERYPSQYPNGEVLRHIAYCTNLILQAVRNK